MDALQPSVIANDGSVLVYNMASYSTASYSVRVIWRSKIIKKLEFCKQKHNCLGTEPGSPRTYKFFSLPNCEDFSWSGSDFDQIQS